MTRVRPKIIQLAVGPMMNFVYLVADEEAKLCAAVDPGWDAAGIADAANANGWRIEKILLTHAHFDHTGALDELAGLTKAQVYVHRDDIGDIKQPAIATEDGTAIAVGGVEIKCMHTPGHTPGSQCFLVDGSVLTGDTLFVDGCGRVDLPGGSPGKMIESLRRLAGLSHDIVVYPGHDYGNMPFATIGELLKINSYLRATNEEMLL